MRLTRRGALALGGGALAAVGAGALVAAARRHGSDDVAPIRITGRSIPCFRADAPHETRFGDLTFRGGLVLEADNPGFGGWSALWRSPDGARLVAVSDNAFWLTAGVSYAESRIAALDDATIAPILGEDGVPLRRGEAYDTESLAIADGVAFVGIERVHEVRRFAWAEAGVMARGVPIAVPAEVKTLPDNQSLEAVAVAPAGHPLAGAVIAIAERARSGDAAPTRGWILTGRIPGTFDVERTDGFDITDLAFLPSGEALMLERRYTLLGGIACRIRLIAPDAILPGSLVGGRLILEADRRHEIDNMEGIATHRDPAGGATVVSLISDDNYNPLQRTLLLEFALSG